MPLQRTRFRASLGRSPLNGGSFDTACGYEMGAGMRRMAWVLDCVLVLAGVASGCTSADSPATVTAVQEHAVDQAPEDVIREYFLAVGRHDDETVESLSSSYLQEMRRTWDDDDRDVRFDMSNLAVTPTEPSDEADLAGRPERYQDYFAVRNGSVEYVMLDDSMTAMAGPQLRFVTVVKETESSPWRVEEIGTGP